MLCFIIKQLLTNGNCAHEYMVSKDMLKASLPLIIAKPWLL
jgi:hypothetical protein